MYFTVTVFGTWKRNINRNTLEVCKHISAFSVTTKFYHDNISRFHRKESCWFECSSVLLTGGCSWIPGIWIYRGYAYFNVPVLTIHANWKSLWIWGNCILCIHGLATLSQKCWCLLQLNTTISSLFFHFGSSSLTVSLLCVFEIEFFPHCQFFALSCHLFERFYLFTGWLRMPGRLLWGCR